MDDFHWHVILVIWQSYKSIHIKLSKIFSKFNLNNLLFWFYLSLLKHFVSILASFCVWRKSLMCKDAANRDSTFQSEVKRNSSSLVSRPDDWAILFGRLLFLIHPSGRRAIPSGRRQSSIIHLDDVFIPSGPFTVSRSICASLHPSGCFSSTSGFHSVLERFSDSFQFPRNERSFNRPDDVGSRPDAGLCKARIAVQH